VKAAQTTITTHANFVVLLAAAGAGCLWLAYARSRTARRIQDAARSKTASAPQGRVELQGAAWPADDAALRAPSGEEVVYYTMKVEREETRGVGRNRHRVWVGVFEKTHSPDFLLVDATGVARVNARNASLDLAETRTRPWAGLGDLERQRVIALLDGRHIAGFPPSTSLFGLFSQKFRVVESEICVGSPLYAQGDFRTVEGGAEGVRVRGLTAFHRQFFDAAAREARKPGDALGNGDDAPSASALRSVMLMAAKMARESGAAPNATEAEFPVSGRLGSAGEQPLMLADRYEEYLVAEKSRGNVLLAIAGLAALAAAAYVGSLTAAAP